MMDIEELHIQLMLAVEELEVLDSFQTEVSALHLL
jgi:hypothetical protein